MGRHVEARAAQPYGVVNAIPGPRFTAQAAASLETSLDDFIRFAQASMSSERAELRTAVLKPETVRAMQQPVPPSPNYGLGYQIQDLNGVRAVGHGGSNSGWQAQFFVASSTGDGLIVMTNSSIGFEVHRQLFCGWPRDAGAGAAVRQGDRAVMASVIAAPAREAATEWRRLKAEQPNDYDFREQNLNMLGRALLLEKRVDDAIAMFELNTEAYPNAFNTWDSLGEGLLVKGDTAAAIRNFEKSVALNPANTDGVETLKRLRKTP
jgi:CubicO group peptidase (beta-lactamase class C family)